MKNFISLNIKFLRSKENMDQQMLGEVIGVTRDVVSSYEREKAVPKLETLQLICSHFEISLDDFINKDLSKVQKVEPGHYYNDPLIGMLAAEPSGGMKSTSYVNEVNILRAHIADKDKIIQMLEKEIDRLKGESNKPSGKTA